MTNSGGHKRGRLDGIPDHEDAKRVKLTAEHPETLPTFGAGEVAGTTSSPAAAAAAAAPTKQGPWDRFNRVVFVATAMNTDGSGLSACLGLDKLRQESAARVAECQAQLQAERDAELLAEQQELFAGLHNLGVLRYAPVAHVARFQEELSAEQQTLRLVAEGLRGLRKAPASRVARCREEFRIEEEAFLRSHVGGGAGPAAAAAAAARARAGSAMTSRGTARETSTERRPEGCAAGVSSNSAWTEEFLAEQEEAFAAAGEQVRQDLKEFRVLVEGPGAAAHEKLAADMAAAGATEAEFLEEQIVLAERIQQWQRREFVGTNGGAVAGNPTLADALDGEVGADGVGGATKAGEQGIEEMGLVVGGPLATIAEEVDEEEDEEERSGGQEGFGTVSGKRPARFAVDGDCGSDTSSMGATDGEMSDLSPERAVCKGRTSLDAGAGKRKRGGEDAEVDPEV
ncbi:unnamed protein product [Ectocarpus sp. CCAP 1310/34]|nr:unnamed protein product [Ectocarpus sp. CCAP 1310/34]